MVVGIPCKRFNYGFTLGSFCGSKQWTQLHPINSLSGNSIRAVCPCSKMGWGNVAYTYHMCIYTKCTMYMHVYTYLMYTSFISYFV